MPAPRSIFYTTVAWVATYVVAASPAFAQLRGGGFQHPLSHTARSSPHPPSPVVVVAAQDGLLEALDRLLVSAYRLERAVQRRDWGAAPRALTEVQGRAAAVNRLMEPHVARYWTPVELRLGLLAGLVEARHADAAQEARNLLEDINVASGHLARGLASGARGAPAKPAPPRATPVPQATPLPSLPPDLQAALRVVAQRLDATEPELSAEVATPVPTPFVIPVPNPRPTPVATPVPTPRPTPVATPVPTPRPTPVATPVPTPRPTPVATPRPTPVATPVPPPAPAGLSVQDHLNKAYVAASTVYTYVRLGQDEVAQNELRVLRAHLAGARAAATPAQLRLLTELDRLAARLQVQLREGDPAAYPSSRALTERFLQVPR